MNRVSDRDHPSRAVLLRELHTRPTPRLVAPARVVHIALKEAGLAAARDRARDIQLLAELAGSDAAAFGERTSATFERAGYRVRFQNHTEHASYTAVQEEVAGLPFSESAADLFPPEVLKQAAARRLAAVIVEIRPMPSDPEAIPAIVADHLDPTSTVVVQLRDVGVVAGDFRADDEGYLRWVLFVDDGVGPGRTGGTAQRLCDLETYRALAMLGFERARVLNRQLTAIDPGLAQLVNELVDDTRAADVILRDLLAVTAELESLAMASDFRFGATAAYDSIVRDRLRILNEQPFAGRRTISDFLLRRYRPAIRTARAADARLARMLDRAARAADLLRTRVDVDRSAQNQSLLRSMDERAETQLRLQHTVEGLSVVAISYYAVGLLGYLFAPLAAVAGVDKIWVMAACTPLVVIGAWWGIRQIRRHHL